MEKIFTSHTSDKGLTMRMCKKFKKLNSKKSNSLIQKWTADLIQFGCGISLRVSCAEGLVPSRQYHWEKTWGGTDWFRGRRSLRAYLEGNILSLTLFASWPPWGEQLCSVIPLPSPRSDLPQAYSNGTWVLPVRHWWLMSAILATQEVAIRRTAIWSQLGQIVRETLSWKSTSQKKDWWRDSRCRPWVQTPAPQNKQTNK
jgi:hypothetical protein